MCSAMYCRIPQSRDLRVFSVIVIGVRQLHGSNYHNWFDYPQDTYLSTYFAHSEEPLHLTSILISLQWGSLQLPAKSANSDTGLEIERRITLADKALYAVSSVLRPKLL